MENWEYHPLDITGFVDVEVKCKPSYFFNPFLSKDSVNESIIQIKSIIQIMEYITSDDFDVDKIIGIVRNSSSPEDAKQNLKDKLKISDELSIYILNKRLMALRSGDEQDKHQLEVLRLFLKHMELYQKDLNNL